MVIPRLAANAPKPASPLKGWRKIDWGDGDPEDLPDVYLRPGALLPLGPVRQHSGESPLEPLTIVINLDEVGLATGVLFEDGGVEYEFVNNQIRRTRYRAQVEGAAVFLRLSGLDGGLPIARRKVLVRVLTDQGEATGEGSERGTIRIPLPASP
jgi:alpha-glucosidase